MDAMAVLKRSVFVVIGKDIVYWRFPSPTPTPVHCTSWCLPDLIKDTSKPIIANHKNNGPHPEDHDTRILWEDAWLREAIRLHDCPGEQPQVPAAAVPPHVRVKRERVTWARTLSASSRLQPIKLDTPSPKKLREEASSSAPINPDFASLRPPSEDEDGLPQVGQAPDSLERELEEIIDGSRNGGMDIESPTVSPKD